MNVIEPTRIVPLAIAGLPVFVCHCPECLPDSRCACRRCEAERARLRAMFSSIVLGNGAR